MEFREVCKAVVLNNFSASSAVSAQDLNQLHEEKRITPLAWAVNKKNLNMAKFLLEKGADPKMCAEEGPSPLLIAIQNKNARMVELLLRYGANANLAIDDLYDTTIPLYEAICGVVYRGLSSSVASPLDRT